MTSQTKYKSQPVTVDGILFASKKEAKRWRELLLLERAGQISDLRRQVKIYMEGRDGPILTPTGRKAAYVADFTYIDTRSGGRVVEDSKSGVKTPDYVLKKAILAAMGIEIYESK